MGKSIHHHLPASTNIKQIKVHVTLFVILLLFSNLTYAQSDELPAIRPDIPHEWEVGMMLGAGTIFGDIPSTNLEALSESKPALGLLATRHLTQTLAIRGGATFAQLDGTRTYENAGQMTTIGYEINLLEVSSVLIFEPLSEERRQEIGRFKKIISPYIFAGFGGNFGKAETSFDNLELTPEIQQDILNNDDKRFNFLFGGGIKYDLNHKFSVGLEVGIRPTFGDLVDGISHAANPNKNDWFGFGGVTINYRIGEPDADGDGIADLEDTCPGAPGLKKFKGCPDSDGDGIKNSKDDCPDLVGSTRLNGCPDSDKDGTADHLDECPNEKGMMRLNGCPDRDWDYVIDSKDECPDVPGKPEYNGCPPPPVEAIEAAETALDAALNEQELQKENAPEPANNLQAVVAPATTDVTESIEEKGIKIDDNSDDLPELENIQFAQNSNQFHSETYRVLKDITEILPQYPNHILHISAYAEVDLNGQINEGIAGKRVFSCYKYLIQAGIPREQLVYYNYKRAPSTEQENGVVIFKLKP